MPTDIYLKDGLIYLHQLRGEDDCVWMAISTAENLPRFIERLKDVNEKIERMNKDGHP